MRPSYGRQEELKERLSEARAESIVDHTRNLCLHPNVYLMDQFPTQIRVIRPPAVRKNEITIHCLAPKGEPAENCALRIRQ